MNHLIHLKDMEKIKNIGLANFDTEHLADLLEEGAPIVSNQVIPADWSNIGYAQ
jgi:diketogulonate reductase-like aldo/keto reductase